MCLDLKRHLHIPIRFGSDSECSDLGGMDDVSPRFKHQTDSLKLGFDKDYFRVGTCNVNSILSEGKLQVIEQILKRNNFSVFAIQETKLSSSIDDSCFAIPGYTSYFRHRNRWGGGTLVYCSNELTSRQLHDYENISPELEMVVIELYVQGKRIIFSSMYRPPKSCKDSFKQCISYTLEKIKSSKPYLTLIGADLNFGGYDFYGTLTTTPFDVSCHEIFEQHLMQQLCDLPTRFATTAVGHSVSLIDNIWTDRPDLVSKGCTYSQVSDHLGLGAQLDLYCPKIKPRIIEKYVFEDMTETQTLGLKNHIQTFMPNDEWTADEHAIALTNHLIFGLQNFVPKVRYRQRNVDIPWSSVQLRRVLRKKNKAYKMYRQSLAALNLLRPTDTMYDTMAIRVIHKNKLFKDASKNYRSQSRAEKNKYFQTLKSVWNDPKISSRKKFSILKKLTKTQKNAPIPPLSEEGEIIDDPIAKANLFNKFFTDKSQVYKPEDKPPNLEKLETNENFENIDTTRFEIGSIIKNMKNSNYSPCGLSSTFIKYLYNCTGSVITQHISDLLNKVFSTGIFPSIWKLSHITPILKSGSKADKSNYRPISILPTLSKVSETVIHNRLLRHLLSNNIITKHQAAYLPEDSTTQQLLSMIHLIKTTMASNNIAQGVFLDVSKAFDAVWHRGLLAKLDQINISGSVYQLFSSYLSGRQAVTVIDGHKSDVLPLLAGVPQGSKLGPLLFIIFMNDIVADLESTPFLYADDTTLIATASSTYQTTNILNRDLTKIYNWSLTWKVTFNPSKSKDIIFSKSLLPSHPTILGLQFIERVNVIRHLGLFISSDLSWDKQIESIVRKVNLKLSIMFQVKGLSRQCLDILYKLHVRSSIDYAIVVFGPSLNAMQLKKLDSLNYRAARLVTGALKFTNSEKLLNELGWESTSKRIEYLSVTLFYKITKNITLSVYECLPPLLNSNYPTNRTYQHYPFMCNFFTNSYFPYAIKKWDTLDPQLRNEPDFTVFKLKMKEILKPHKFKHFNCGFRYPNTLHTHLRLGRSSLNSHLYEIGQSTTKSCKQCGFHTESCEHYLLDCVAFANERVQLFQKLEGLLEKRPQTYSKKNLFNILLFGEKPYLSEKHTHNKHIFFSVQAFICKSKRLFFTGYTRHNHN